MDLLAAYLPTDRLHALADGVTLPSRARGTALFADISGFTPLTEALVRMLGPRRGADELARQLNEIYDALIAEVDRYGGSVIAFSGDAITCWFDDRLGTGDWEVGTGNTSSQSPAPNLQPLAPLRATACALMMQRAMARFGGVALPSGGVVTLALKAAIASGTARRMVVGDPAIQRIDVLAGAALDRVAVVEHLAHRADVMLSPECARALGESALIVEWRADAAGVHFPVIGGLMEPVASAPWPPRAPGIPRADQLRPWLLPAVYDRIRSDQGELVPELRPAVALFLRFGGIAYEDDPLAEDKLDRYMRWVQRVLEHYGGTLIQLSMGDKGSYLYAAFGAPIAHEDDARRAVTAALELRAPPPDLSFMHASQLGIASGTMLAGAYGGTTRRTYGVLGDAVNLAARLMMAAAPGEVLASRRVQQMVSELFEWADLPALLVKGKRTLIPVAQLVGARPALASALGYAGPLIGRAGELAQLQRAIAPIFAGKFAGLVYVNGEAGMGKSRLVYELRQSLIHRPVPARQEAHVTWYACPAEGMRRQSLYPFRSFLRAYFDQDADGAEAENSARFETVIGELVAFLATNDERRTTNNERQMISDQAEGMSFSSLATQHSALAAELEQARSFLGALVDLRWAGSPYEKAEPRQRFERTLAAFRTLVLAESLRQPVVIQIEDAHWLDDDSREVIRVLARAAGAYPFAVLLASRYSDDGHPILISVGEEIDTHSIDLLALTQDGVRALAAHVLGGPIADDLAAFLAAKTNGNPFFVEQLALDLRERGLLIGGAGTSKRGYREQIGDLRNAAGTQAQVDSPYNLSPVAYEIPPSISAVLIARLDRLAAPLKAVVQMAAVLGQEFDTQVLARMRPDAADTIAYIRAAEAAMIWLAAGDTRYRFRHSLLRDAAYDMQVYARLRELHARAGAAIEQIYGEALAGQIAELAYHYGQAEDTERERQYVALLGEQAFNLSAFREAIGCFERALTLTPEDGTRRARLTFQLARTVLLLNDHDHGRRLYEQSLALSEAAGDQAGVAAACYELATLVTDRSAHDVALKYLARALELYQNIGDQAGQGRVLNRLGGLYIELGDADQALAAYEQALELGNRGRGRRG
jgi:predicted ATPase/class 3 adenylate cyclase